MKLDNEKYYDATTLAKYFQITEAEVRRRAKKSGIKPLKKLFEITAKAGSKRQIYKLTYLLGDMKQAMKWVYRWEEI